MSYGIYISAGPGGTITCVPSNPEAESWSTSTNSISGYSGFTEGATFTAEPDSGYVFSYFEIYLDSANESYENGELVDESTTNPMSLDPGDDGTSYHIMAIFESDGSAGDDTNKYTIVSKGAWKSSVTSQEVYIAPYEVHRYGFSTSSSAVILTFSSDTPDVDTVGWINENFNATQTLTISDKGIPSAYFGTSINDIDKENGNLAFSATANLSKTTTYWIDVCCYNGGSGNVTLTVNTAPLQYTVKSAGTWDNTVTSYEDVSIPQYKVLKYVYTAPKDGILTFSSTTTDTNTMGWISTVSESGYAKIDAFGNPLNSIGSYEDNSNVQAFSASAEVTSGTKYYLYVYCPDGVAATATLTANVEDKIKRPSDWSWITTIAKGSDIKLTADEWNSFTSRINEFREYDGLSSYVFTAAISGVTPIEATICNEAHTAIDEISEHGVLPQRLELGGPLYASFFNELKNALNSIS